MATPTQIRRRGRRSLILGTIFAAVLFAAVAYADDIKNDLAGSANVMALNVDGPAGSTVLTVVPQNGDGKNGCNLTGSKTLSVTVGSSAPSVATVDPASLTFESCGDTKTITVTPVGEGSSNVTLTQTSNTTEGSFNLGPAAFRVDVAPPPNTAPDVTVTGVAHGAEYVKGSVPAAGCSVEDAEDGDSTFAASLSAITGTYSADGLGNQTATCSYTDEGGLYVEESATYSIYDDSAPGIESGIVGTLGSNGWYVSNVALTWTVTESESPNSLSKTNCVDQDVTADQAATDYSCSALSAGGSAGPVTVSIKRDATKPTISGSRLPAANGAGWNNTDVTVSFLCSDATSLIASCGPTPITLSSNGADQSVTGTAVDNAGNSDTATVSGINIDKLAPSVAYTSASPVANAAGWNNTNVTATFTASDTLSGFAPSGALSVTGTSIASDEGSNVTVGSPAFADRAGNGVAAGAASTSFKIDKTAPSVNCGSAPSGWSASDVLIACTAGDELSQLASAADASFNLSTSVDAGTETDNASTGTRTVSDNADNSRIAGPVTGIKVDKKKPTFSCATAPTTWSATDVTINCTAADGGSGLTPTEDASFALSTTVPLGTETDNASTGSKLLTDGVGHAVTAPAITGLKVDKKPPAISCGSADSVWHNDNISIACTATDGGSGLASPADAGFSLSTTVAAGDETSNAATGSKSVADAVGRSATAGPISGNKIDRKAPVVTMTCPTTPVLLGSNYSASWSATDGGSGVVTGFSAGTIPLNTSTVGTKTAIAPAGASKDNVNNLSVEASCSYSVVYNWNGFFQPVDNLPVLNKAKAGSAIPVKFSLGGNQGLNIFAAGYPATSATVCGNTGSADLVEETVTAGGSSLTYDSSAGQYVYVWKTQSGWSGSCRTLTVKLIDGTIHQANFYFVK